MLQATDDLRTKWQHNHNPGEPVDCICEYKAHQHLLSRGILLQKGGMYEVPKDHEWSDEDSSALDFLCDEWDYGWDYGPARNISAPSGET